MTLALVLAGCGGGEQEAQSEQSEQNAQGEISKKEQGNPVVAISLHTQINGESLAQQQTVQAGVLNATGGFDYPKNNSQVRGNLTLQVSAADEQGLSRVYLYSPATEMALVLCDSNCGNSFEQLVNGINPRVFDWQQGQNTLQLMVEDVEQNVQSVAQRTINWQQVTLSGATASLSGTTLSIGWTANQQLLRYNVYIAEEAGLEGANFEQLNGGDARLGVTTNSVSFDNKSVENDYYILITGVDGTGESAFSNTVVLFQGQLLPPPNAVNDTFSVDEEQTLSASLIDNDSAAEGSSFTIDTNPVVLPSNGTVVINTDGTFSYTPNVNFNGVDVFTYQIVSPEGLAAQASVSIEVNPINDAPIATRDSFEIDGDVLTVSAPGLLNNDSDIDSNELTVVTTPVSAPGFGELVLSSDGGFVYTKGEGFLSGDTFSYQVSDGELLSEPVSVEITIPDTGNAPPVAINDSYEMLEDSVLTITAEQGVLSNDSDSDNALSELSVNRSGASDPNNGNLVINSDGSFSYTPNANFFGVEEFTYNVTDPAGNVATANVYIDISNINDAPIAATEQYVFAAGVTNSVPRVLGILQNDIDPDGDTIAIVSGSVGLPSSGTLTLNDDGSFDYTPNDGFTGVDSFTYQITDNNSEQALTSAETTVQLNVIEAHAVIGDGGSAAISVDEVLSALPSNASITGVSASNGTATLVDGEIQYSASAGIGGLDTISVTIEVAGESSSYELFVFVDGDNVAPVIISGTSINVNENSTFGSIVHTVIADDETRLPLSFSLSDPQNTFTIDPETGQISVVTSSALDYESTTSYTLDVGVTDQLGASATQVLTINIRDLNEAPSLSSVASIDLDENTPNGTEVDISLSVSDDDGNQFSFALLSDVYGIFAIHPSTGALTIADNSNLNFELVTSYAITIRALETDGVPTNLSETVNITVNVNDVDEITDTDQDGLLDSDEVFYGSDINDPDSDDDGLNDGEEVEIGTNPIDADTDNDLINDGDEVTNGTDPLNSDVTPPEFIAVGPANISTGVCINQLITLTANDQLSSDTITATNVKVLQDGVTEVAGTLMLSESLRIVSFQSDSAFATDTMYQVQVSGVKDEAGNLQQVSFSSEFTTGTCIESVPPTVESISPINGADNVPINSTVRVKMSEPVAPASVNSDTFYVYNFVTGEKSEGEITLTENNTVLTFAPNDNYAVARRYYVYVQNGLTDIYGNSVSSTNFYFNTSFVADSDAPQVLSTSVSEGQTDVPLNARIAVLFDEAIDVTQTTSVFVQDATGADVTTSAEFTDNYSRVVLVPDANLQASTTYQLVVESASDLAGNSLQSTTTINFTTGTETDTTSEGVALWSLPSNGLQDLPLNTELWVELAEPIDVTSLNEDSVYLYDSSQQIKVAAEVSVDSSRTRITLVPDEALLPNRVYYVYLSYYSYLYDFAGNIVASFNTRYFTTGTEQDDTALNLERSSFASGSVDVPINGQLVFYFDQPLNVSCDLADAFSLSLGGNTVATSASLSSDRTTVTVVADDVLSSNSEYELTISGLCDFAGNEMQQQVISFTTTADTSSDTTGPSLLSMSPENTATDVSITSNIVMEFSEAIDLQSRPPVRHNDVTVPGTYQVSGSTLTFIPDEPLLGSTSYVIQVYRNVPDLAGNTTYIGTRSFTTETSADTQNPSVTMSTPIADSIDVSPSTDIFLSFDEPIASGTINSSNIAVYQDGDLLSPYYYRSDDGQEINIDASLEENSIITIVLTDRVTDIAGNPLPETVFSFTTGVNDIESSRPSIVQQTPQSGSSGWQSVDNIYLYFSETIDVSSAAEAIRVVEDGEIKTVNIESLTDNQILKLTVSEPFNFGSRVEVFVDETLTDVAGNSAFSYSSYFDMDEDPIQAGSRPYVVDSFPHSEVSSVPTNPLIQVAFNEELDPQSLVLSNIILYNQTDSPNSTVEISASLSQNSRALLVRPLVALNPGDDYYLRVENLRDTDGDEQQYISYSYFTVDENGTEDTRQPRVVSMSPPAGESSIGTNTTFSIRYDEIINPVSFAVSGVANVYFDSDNHVVRYSRAEPLQVMSEHTETSPLMMDLAGNESIIDSTTFTVGDGPDLINPSIVDQSFVNYQTNIPLDPIFRWQFSEPIDPNSITSDGVYLYDNVTGDTLATTASLSADGMTLTVVPESELLVLRRYYQYLYGLRDLSGNTMGYQTAYITTGTTLGGDAPTPIAYSVADGETDIPINTKLNIRFDQPLSPTLPESIQLLDTQGNEVQLNVSFERDRSLLSLVPTTLLQPLTEYTLSVSGITDIGGNVQQQGIEISFTTSNTVDIIGGSVTQWSFDDNTQNVPLNPLLQVSFSEAVDPTTFDSDSFYLRDWTHGSIVESEITLSDDLQSATLRPNAPLRTEALHYLYVSNTEDIKDRAGNLLPGYDRVYFYTGNSADEGAPSVSSSSIPSGATDIQINGQIVLSFSEPISAQCDIEDGIQLLQGSTVIATDISLSNDDTQLTITPSATLENSQTYQLQVSNVCDYAGNEVASYQMDFTTGTEAEDSTAPTLVSMTPIQNSTEIDPNTASISLTFSEPIRLVSEPPVSAGGIDFSGTYDISGNTLTFTPEHKLLGSSRHYVELYSRVADYAGNVTNLGAPYFDTAAAIDDIAPTISSISPASGEVDVSPNRTITVEFSEPMSTLNMNSSHIALFADGVRVSPSVSRTVDGRFMTLSANIPANTVINVAINGVLEDLSGNSLSPFVSSFVTGLDPSESVRPSIVKQVPNSYSELTSLDKITLYTSEAIDASTLEGALTIEQDGALIAADFTLVGDNRTLVISKDGGFASGKRTAFYISGLRDLSGNLLYDYDGNFTLNVEGDGVGEVFYPTAYFPNSSSDDTPLNPVLMVRFNEAIDASSLQTGRVILYDITNNDAEIPVTMALDDSGYVLRVTPSQLLVADNTYYLWLSRDLLDTDGDNMYGNYATYFYTQSDAVEDDTQPTVLAFSPPQGQTNVATNPRVTIRFDEPINSLSFDPASENIVDVLFSNDNWAFSYELLEPLSATTEYTITTDFVSDLAGNSQTPLATTFTTGSGPDLTNPSYADVNISSGQQNVVVNPVIRWAVSEPLDPATLSDSGIYLYDNTANVNIDSTWSLSSDGRVVSLSPNQALDLGSTYYAYLQGAKDLSGNSLSNSQYYFVVNSAQDTIGPTLSSATVDEGQTDIPLNMLLNLRFDEPLNVVNVGSYTLVDSSDNPVYSYFGADRDRSLFYIRPRALLSANETYTLNLSGVTDIAGNVLASDVVLNFTTGDEVDLASPTVSQFSIPNSGVVDVPLNPLLQVVFSDRVDEATIDSDSFSLYDETNNEDVAGSWTLDSSQTVLTFTPDEALLTETLYYLQVSYSDGITDFAGNRISANYRYFTTGTESDSVAPSIDTLNVANGTLDMPINGQVVMEFNEPLSAACDVESGLSLTSSGVSVDINVSIDSARDTIIVTGSDGFEPSTSYSLEILSLCDYAGNEISGNVLSFTTTSVTTNDTSGPAVVSISPTNVATDVSVSTSIVVEYDEVIDLRSAPVLKQGTTVIEGSYSISGNVLTFTPSVALDSLTTYTFELQYNVPDYAGRTRWGGNITFTTGS